MNNSNLNDNFSGLSVSKYPETIVLFITTHGGIIKRKDNSLMTLNIPEGMRVIRTLSSIPGECNITNEVSVEIQSKLINKNMNSLTSNQFNRQLNAAKKVLEGIRKEDLSPETLNQIEEDSKFFSRKRQRLEQIKKYPYINAVDNDVSDDDIDYYDKTRIYSGYIYGIDRAHKLNVFESGEKMLDKQYSRENVEATSTNWIIKIMNIPGQPDILRFLKRQLKPRTEQQVEMSYFQSQTKIYLSEIINFLRDKGVKTVIIFDVSCSNIFIENTDNEEVSEAESRMLRRRIIEEKLGGKSRKIRNRNGSKRRYLKNKSVKRNKRYARGK